MRISTCPFCGHGAKASKSMQWISISGLGRAKSLVLCDMVYCKKCFSKTKYYPIDNINRENLAIEAWNKSTSRGADGL